MLLSKYRNALLTDPNRSLLQKIVNSGLYHKRRKIREKLNNLAATIALATIILALASVFFAIQETPDSEATLITYMLTLLSAIAMPICVYLGAEGKFPSQKRITEELETLMEEDYFEQIKQVKQDYTYASNGENTPFDDSNVDVVFHEKDVVHSGFHAETVTFKSILVVKNPKTILSAQKTYVFNASSGAFKSEDFFITDLELADLNGDRLTEALKDNPNVYEDLKKYTQSKKVF